ncbi:hypothetical protein L3081_23555 [Colwellia sp. MSW7]|uniref:Uncharacterized protein n=1 Tax=Colwellia maritima TaxID=2912588 RepID=A0ABS9X6F9_9GAMM|nr:hypothetical protein [Colwellia maritima]MCI2285811.1 hypothetical protein [Colwellia maritima]
MVSEKELAINKIFLDTLQSNVIIAKDGTLANLVALPRTPAEETEDVTSAENNEISQTTEIDTAANVDTEKSDFTISLNEFSLINDNEITLLDNSVEPVKPQKLFIDTLFLGAISNALNKRDQRNPF